MTLGVRVASGVIVAVAVSVSVGEGMGVRVGGGVHVSVTVGIAVGGKTWFASGLPNTAEAPAKDASTKASTSHCQPATMRARRVR